MRSMLGTFGDSPLDRGGGHGRGGHGRGGNNGIVVAVAVEELIMSCFTPVMSI